MTAPQAWRIYHHDAMNKTELTSSPSRVKKSREAGLTVVELHESAELALSVLNDDERLSVFENYCTSCGCKDPLCPCWNYE